MADFEDKYQQYLDGTLNEQHAARQGSKMWYVIGWIELSLAVVLLLFVLWRLVFIGYEGETVYIRAAVILPLAALWGIWTIRKNRGWRDA